ncbi:MAG: leucine-rich repeat domain-containing protein, partial [Muribaculaceae bacterium]|nr:leucine-rich repeat domain-containing protein [Muribaculaceae bacterium]
YAIQTFAGNFTYEYKGQTITYTVIDPNAKTCKTADGNQYGDVPGNRVSGDLVLPSNPQDGDVEYTLTEIGGYAFQLCREMTSIVIPNSVTTIRHDAFAGCSSLTAVEIPNSVTLIENSVFAGCSGLTTVEISNCVTSIGSSVFNNCSSLTAIAIPNSVTSIGPYAFLGCSSLTSVEIPNSVQAIGMWAFYSCSSLTSVSIGNSVQSIGRCAFSWCTALTSVVIPNSVTYIDPSAFEYCSSLTWAVIPNSVTYIGWDVFYKCDSLIRSACPYGVTNPFSSGIIISYPREGAIAEDGFIYGPDKSFIYFAPLDLEGDFITPESVETIGSYAFYDCSALTSLTLSKKLNKIGTQAFYGCDMIKTIIYPTQKPCELDTDIFSAKVFRSATLYVPDEAVNTFKSLPVWCLFRHIKGIESSGIEDVLNNSDSCEIDYSTPYEVYNLNGVKVGNSTDGLAPGLYIVRQGRAVEKIALPFSYF